MADVPVLPDASRMTSYSVSTPSTGPFNVGFDIYQTGTDQGAMVEVWDDGVKLTAGSDWTLDSPSGGLSILPRPITDARITFATARSGAIKIVGAHRPRRLTQLAENRGVPAHDHNLSYTAIIAQLREIWDRDLRAIMVRPGETGGLLPLAADLANKYLGGDPNGTLAALAPPTVATIVASEFNTYSAAQNTNVAVAITYLRLLGYYAAGDGGGGLYVKVGAQPAHLGRLQTLDGAWWELKCDGYVTPRQFGAQCNGSADDAPAVRAASEMMFARAGGGTVVLLAGDTYLMKTLSPGGGGMIIPRSNVNFIGAGENSQIKIGDNSQGLAAFGWTLWAAPTTGPEFAVHNARYSNFKVDFNGANNAGNDFSNWGIAISHGSNILVENVSFFDHPGNQIILFGTDASPSTTSRCKILNCRFQKVGAVSNGSVSDHSTIYSNTNGLLCVGNTFEQPATNQIVAAAFEIHGSNNVICGNNTIRYNRFCNIAATRNDNKRTVFVGNVAQACYQAAVFFADVSWVLDGIIIEGNVFEQHLANIGPLIDCNTAVAGGTHGSVKIRNNIIYSLEAAGGTSVFPGVRSGHYTLFECCDNTFTDLAGAAFELGATYSARSVVEVSRNKIIDCGRTSNALFRRGMKLNSAGQMQAIVVMNNYIANISTVYMTVGIEASMSNTVNRARIRDNIYYNVTTQTSISTSSVPLGFAVGTPAIPATGVGNAVTNEKGVPVAIYLAGQSGTRKVDQSGSTYSFAAEPTLVFLLAGEKIWFNTTAPSSWQWEQV